VRVAAGASAHRHAGYIVSARSVALRRRPAVADLMSSAGQGPENLADGPRWPVSGSVGGSAPAFGSDADTTDCRRVGNARCPRYLQWMIDRDKSNAGHEN